MPQELGQGLSIGFDVFQDLQEQLLTFAYNDVIKEMVEFHFLLYGLATAAKDGHTRQPLAKALYHPRRAVVVGIVKAEANHIWPEFHDAIYVF